MTCQTCGDPRATWVCTDLPVVRHCDAAECVEDCTPCMAAIVHDDHVEIQGGVK